MKTEPIIPAEIRFGDDPDAPPTSPTYDDIYHPRVGAAAQARHVFMGGNGLPRRWQGCARHTVLETGFGLGNNFLATWDAWRSDPRRCERLHYVAIERHPPRLEDLQRAHARSPWPDLAARLIASWPPLTPDLHLLDFEDGRVQLLLALGDVAQWLPALRLQADSVFLDGFAPARNPAMWQPRVLKAVARLAAPGATLATWSVAGELRAGLQAAGFEVGRAPGIGGKREITVARWAPRHAPRRPPDPAVASGEAVVVGAGMAGAAVAQALALQGLAVTVIDRRAQPAAETSGNPAGLFHGTVHPDDGPYARLFRAAALHAAQLHGAAVRAGHVTGQVQGLLRLDDAAGGAAALQARLQATGLPPGYVQVLDAAAASAAAGVGLPAAGWSYPGGGWLEPASWVLSVLALPQVRWLGETAIAALRDDGDAWSLLDAQGTVRARAPVVVLANAAGTLPLIAPHGHAAWPLRHTRGQVTSFEAAHTLRRPVAGDGYVLPLPGGRLLCGATRHPGEPAEGRAPGDATGAADGDAPRDEDHAWNLYRLRRLAGLGPSVGTVLQGRTGWRLHTDDRLPIAGALARPAPAQEASARQDQARLLPRERGLFVLTALGARGLTLAPLLGRLVAAQVTGAPWPLPQDLVDAIDPARWTVRAARRSG